MPVVYFMGMFFKLAPYINAHVPPGEWQKLIQIGAYFVVAAFGGVGLPIVIVFFSIIILIY